LVDWLKHPTGLPVDAAIKPDEAMWTAREITEQTGLYDARSDCLADLNALLGDGVLLRFGNPWRCRPTTWVGVIGTSASIWTNPRRGRVGGGGLSRRPAMTDNRRHR
jgi:hypothetical protein